MLTLNQIHAQIETLANAHYQIAEVGMGTLSELQANPDRLYPLLWLSNEGGSLEDNYKIDNVRLTMFGRVISGEEGQDDDATEIEVLSDMQLILLDFLNYFHQQHAQEYVVAKSASLEHFTERTNDRTAGYSCILELKQFYDWNKCQIPESGAGISPSVDGLTLYDFCDQSVLDRLTATQTACLEDEFGGTCAPAILTANTATFTTVASGGTLDIQVHDTADANVGTVASTSEIEIGNSSNEVNGVDIAEPTVAEGTHNQVIQNSAATPVGTAANPSVIGDSQAQVNGVNTETIAATVTHNQQIQDSAGGSVGTAANPSVISDNTINFNGADVDTVKAQESYPFLVKLDGTNSGTYNAGTNTVSVTSAVCADATTQVNAVNVGTVASGGTFDQQIHDSAGADIGTSANPSVVSDATVTINSSSLGATGSVVAQGSVDLVVNLDGSPSGSWDGDSWEVTSAVTPCASVVVGVSDATPVVGDVVTITATPSDITPTTYVFFVKSAGGNFTRTSQASNVLSWRVMTTGTFDLQVTADDTVSNVVSITASWSFDQAIQLNGTTQYLQGGTGSFQSIFSNDIFFVNLWFNADSFASIPMLFANTTATEFVEVDAANLYIRWGSSLKRYTGLSLSTGTWYMVSLVKFASGNNLQAYIDGVLLTSSTGTIANASGTNDIIVGKYNTSGFYLDGKLDEIFVKNDYIPTASKVLEIYNSGAGNSPTVTGEYPDWYLPLNGDADDYSGNGIDLTEFNSPTYVAH